MPDWAIHLIVPLLVLLIVVRKEEHKYILLLLPFAILPDIDTFATQHRALLHNVFIPLVLVLIGISLKKFRTIFFIAAFYVASHVFLDMFGGGVVLFYPFFNEMAYIDASIEISKTNALLWTFDYGFTAYGDRWKLAQGYISDSVGTGSLALVFAAGVWAARYRLSAWRNK
ncbi:MAG: metal-dependent hydrolase [Candidatus Methanoperedens sp.]|nr:metal-dependent hydrolase [Candidatus Methanoperedens sp.]